MIGLSKHRMPTEFRILVADTPRCIKLLKYIDMHIEDIVRSTHYFLDIVKVDSEALKSPDTSRALKGKGITGLPAMIAPNKKVIAGFDRIVNIFDRETTKRVGAGRSVVSDFGTNPDLAGFYAKEMFEVKNGVLEKRTDADGDRDRVGEGDVDIDQKLREYRAPSHRVVAPTQVGGQHGGDAPQRHGGERSALDDMMAEALRGGGPEDNVGPPTNMAERYGGGNGRQGGDADARMMQAYLDRIE